MEVEVQIEWRSLTRRDQHAHMCMHYVCITYIWLNVHTHIHTHTHTYTHTYTHRHTHLWWGKNERAYLVEGEELGARGFDFVEHFGHVFVCGAQAEHVKHVCESVVGDHVFLRVRDEGERIFKLCQLFFRQRASQRRPSRVDGRSSVVSARPPAQPPRPPCRLSSRRHRLCETPTVRER